MATQTVHGKKAQKLLFEGIEEVAKAVIVTLGPKGQNVAIGRKWQAPKVVHDGVTVAKAINPKNPFKNMGAQLIKEAASKTDDSSGDGTTTATLLAYKLATEGRKLVDNGANPMILKKGIDKAVEVVVQQVKSFSKPVKTKDEVKHVATISAQNEEIGDLVTQVMEETGKDGVVSVEDGNGMNITYELKKGMEFDRGYISAYFATNAEKMTAEVKEPLILLTEKRLASFEEILPFVEMVLRHSKNFVIIAESIDGEALAGFVINKLQGKMNFIGIQTPGFGERKKEMLQDIAVLTGATIISDETGRTIESITIADLGRADKVWADKDSTLIVGGKGSKRDIKRRINQIKAQIKEQKTEFEVEALRTRLAKLVSGVGVISVGAASESEQQEKKERVIDAVEATKSAREEGIVVGGGLSLLRARESLTKLMAKLEGDEKAGVELVYRVLEEPVRQLAKNSGSNGDYILQTILDIWKSSKSYEMGFDASTGTITNLLKKGVIDPAKVIRNALEFSASVASMILTTKCLINEIPEESKQQ